MFCQGTSCLRSPSADHIIRCDTCLDSLMRNSGRPTESRVQCCASPQLEEGTSLMLRNRSNTRLPSFPPPPLPTPSPLCRCLRLSLPLSPQAQAALDRLEVPVGWVGHYTFVMVVHISMPVVLHTLSLSPGAACPATSTALLHN